MVVIAKRFRNRLGQGSCESHSTVRASLINLVLIDSFCSKPESFLFSRFHEVHRVRQVIRCLLDVSDPNEGKRDVRILLKSH